MILAVPAFLAVTTIFLPDTLTEATELLADFAVNFFEAFPFVFTVTLKDFFAVLLDAGIVMVAFLVTLFDLTYFFVLALASIYTAEKAKLTQRTALKVINAFFIIFSSLSCDINT